MTIPKCVRSLSVLLVLAAFLASGSLAMGAPKSPLKKSANGRHSVGHGSVPYSTGVSSLGRRAQGPLRVHPDNPRYFRDRTGKPVYLAGANTWGNVQDGHTTAWLYEWGDPFDYEGYLDRLSANDLNYARLWLYETAWVTFGGEFPPEHPAPNPWQRTGPGTALDGGPKFDVTKFDQSYFDRLRARVRAARDRGIYVSVLLFEGWSVQPGTPGRLVDHVSWNGHPFNKENNVNGIDGDTQGDGGGLEFHRLEDSAITRLQEQYVRKVVDTVNDLDNVIIEICNECFFRELSDGFQHHMIDYVKTYQATKPQQHPILLSKPSLATVTLGNDPYWESGADAIAPGGNLPAPYHWRLNPPPADGRKVVIFDTDHVGATLYVNDPASMRAWVWKSFTRGQNPSLLSTGPNPGFMEGERAMGDTRRYAEQVDLAEMTPQELWSSTGYCLADAGSEYLVYQPASGTFTVFVTEGKYRVEWFNPVTAETTRGSSFTWRGGHRTFTPPFDGEAVLYLKSRGHR